MTTDKLYYRDPYLRETEATVTAVTDKGFLLTASVFYPECGGQRGDSGFFGPYRIVTTEKDGEGNPLHITDGPLPSVGDTYTLKLDWEERFFGMVEHTAQHLLSSILYNSFGIGTVAVHHGTEEITIETDLSTIAEEKLLSVEEEAVRLIGENRRVWSEDMTHQSAEELGMRRSIKIDDDVVKVVFIEGQDAVACGGVHLSTLGQIGEIEYIGSDTIRSHCRTYWRVGEKARDYRRENVSAVLSASALLSCDRFTLTDGVRHILDENRELRHTLKALEKKAAENEFNSHTEECVVYPTDYELDALIEAACSDTERKIFITGPKNTFMYIGKKDDFNVLKNALSLRGGGRDPLFRGTFTQSTDDILCSAKNLLGSL